MGTCSQLCQCLAQTQVHITHASTHARTLTLTQTHTTTDARFHVRAHADIGHCIIPNPPTVDYSAFLAGFRNALFTVHFHRALSPCTFTVHHPHCLSFCSVSHGAVVLSVGGRRFGNESFGQQHLLDGRVGYTKSVALINTSHICPQCLLILEQ